MVALLVILLLVSIATAALLWPLPHQRRSREHSSPDGCRDIARMIKLQELADLELDYSLGKLAEDDYRDLKNELRAEAIDVIVRGGGPASPQAQSSDGERKR
jgi:cytochrome c-type biogenesis protein CcmI